MRVPAVPLGLVCLWIAVWLSGDLPRVHADAIAATALLDRYAREYQSLKSISLAGFAVAADMESKKALAGVDAVGRVTLDVKNSEGRHFSFTDASRSVLNSTAKVVIAAVRRGSGLHVRRE